MDTDYDNLRYLSRLKPGQRGAVPEGRTFPQGFEFCRNYSKEDFNCGDEFYEIICVEQTITSEMLGHMDGTEFWMDAIKREQDDDLEALFIEIEPTMCKWDAMSGVMDLQDAMRLNDQQEKYDAIDADLPSFNDVLAAQRGCIFRDDKEITFDNGMTMFDVKVEMAKVGLEDIGCMGWSAYGMLKQAGLEPADFGITLW